MHCFFGGWDVCARLFVCNCDGIEMKLEKLRAGMMEQKNFLVHDKLFKRETLKETLTRKREHISSSTHCNVITGVPLIQNPGSVRSSV